MKITVWTPEETELLLAHYKTDTMSQLSDRIGKSVGSVRGKKERLGLSKWNNGNKWSAQQLDILRGVYSLGAKAGELDLESLARLIGKSKSNICRKARELGLTNQKRQKAYPMNQSQEARDAISKRAVARLKNQSNYSHIENGWVTVGGKSYFFRSKWEMNYANYLEWLLGNGAIESWEYEVDTFWFEKIKRGVRSYTPDFKVTKKGLIEYHEVKGYMNAKSITKLNRMRIYYPEVKMVLIDEPVYKSLKKQLGDRIMPY
jgi:hypothetical protein